jgi:hypothetical protein
MLNRKKGHTKLAEQFYRFLGVTTPPMCCGQLSMTKVLVDYTPLLLTL